MKNVLPKAVGKLKRRKHLGVVPQGSSEPGDAEKQTTRRIRQAIFMFVTALAGVGTAFWSWTLSGTELGETERWWSSTLANVAVAIFLLVPDEFVLTRIRTGFERIEKTTNEVRTTAESALESAEQTARSLDDVRQKILERQRSEYEEELDVYRDIVTNLSRESLIKALRKATLEEVISANGVRSPIWETPVHYRYLIDETEDSVNVQIEEDDGAIVSTHFWEPGVDSADFCQELVLAVREAGEDLGVGLNDPTLSIEQLSEMLVDAARHRAQELMGHRETLKRIIERRNGWYFTEKYVMPEKNLSYTIGVERLDELDWEEHLLGKGWYEAPEAIQFARRIYGSLLSEQAAGKSD